MGTKEPTRVRVLPLAAAPFALCVEPAAPEEQTADPFRRLGTEPGARAYLATLVSDAGTVVDRLVLRLAPDAPPAEAFPELPAPATNPQVETAWAAARRDLAQLAQSPRHFPPLVLPAVEAGDAVPAMLPPLLWAPGAPSLLPIPCPTCLGALRTCRDEAVLAEHGVPGFAATRVALVWCPDCAAAGTGARLWDLSEDAAHAGAESGVGSLEDLRRDLEAAVAAASSEGSDGDPVRSELLVRLAPGQPAWQPFTRRDTPFLVTRFSPFTLGAFADVLGGRPAAEAAPGADVPDGSGLLLSSEGSGVDAVEVLALKVGLFAQLLRAARAYHRLLGLPHLNLHPDQAVVELGTAGDRLPHLWSFQARLLGTSSSRRLELTPEVAVVLPPPSLHMPFSSPAVRDFWLLSPRPGSLLVDRLVAAGKGAGAGFRLEGRLLDPQGIFPAPTPRDWFVLTWGDGLLGPGVNRAVARLDERPRRAGEVPLVTEPLPVDAAQAKRLQNVSGLQIPRVEYKIYPEFGLDDDLYALGMLFLRLLVVNDRQDLGSVAAAVTASLQARSEAGRDADAAAWPDHAAAAVLADHPDLFARANLLHRRVDREEGRPVSVPEEIWRDALSTAVGLIARFPGPTTAAAPPPLPLEEVVARVDALHARLLGLLFHREPLHVEIQSVIAHLLAEGGGA